ncbi:unnamed protein product [Dicrocoelium dendriticum]|nr:unnamed protein product [Dicrocoelium dendriticum]
MKFLSFGDFQLTHRWIQILMDDEQRREYDEMLDSPERMYFHYYKYYRRRYSPKVDVRVVIVTIILLYSILQYIGQWTSYRHALSYLVRDPRHRNKARDIANAQGLLAIRRKNCGTKMTREELKEREDDILRTIISQTVELRGDFSRPSLRRVLAVQLVVLPYTCFQWSLWAFTWMWSYWIMRRPYDDRAKAFLTRRRLGLSAAQWDALDEVRREGFMRKELWVRANYQAYLAEMAEEMRAQSAESSQSKRYRRYVKQAGGPSQIGMEHVDF